MKIFKDKYTAIRGMSLMETLIFMAVVSIFVMTLLAVLNSFFKSRNTVRKLNILQNVTAHIFNQLTQELHWSDEVEIIEGDFLDELRLVSGEEEIIFRVDEEGRFLKNDEQLSLSEATVTLFKVTNLAQEGKVPCLQIRLKFEHADAKPEVVLENRTTISLRRKGLELAGGPTPSPSPLSSPSPSPVPSNLVAYWKFDEGEGLITQDSSGNGHDGTLVNGPTWTTGKTGEALDFDGDDDYVDAGTDSSLNMDSGDFTLEAWFKTTTTSNGILAGKGSIFTGGKRYYLGIGITPGDCGAGEIKAEIDDNTTKKYICSSLSSYNDGNWHHAAIVRDGNNLRLYMDGSEDSNSPIDITDYGNIDSVSSFKMGGIYNEDTSALDEYFRGIVDEVQIWNVARTQAQIQTDM